MNQWAKDTGSGTIRMWQVMRFLKCYNIAPERVLAFSDTKADHMLDKLVSDLPRVASIQRDPRNYLTIVLPLQGKGEKSVPERTFVPSAWEIPEDLFVQNPMPRTLHWSRRHGHGRSPSRYASRTFLNLRFRIIGRLRTGHHVASTSLAMHTTLLRHATCVVRAFRYAHGNGRGCLARDNPNEAGREEKEGSGHSSM